MEDVKYFNYGQTVGNQPKLFDFGTSKYNKYFDELLRIWL